MSPAERDVFLAAGGMTSFSRRRHEADFRELGREAFENALDQLPELATEDIDASVMCYYSDYFTKQSSAHLAMHDYLGLSPRPCIRVDTASSSGGTAIQTARHMIASGQYHVCVVLGFSEMGRISTNRAIDLLALSSDLNFEYPLGVFWSGFFGMVAHRQMHELGWDESLFDMVSVKNHINATHNPLAQRPEKLTPEDIHDSTLVSSPLHKLHCSLLSEGAACLIMCNAEWAARLADRPVAIAGTGSASDTARMADRSHGQITMLQHEDPRQYEGMFDAGFRYPGVHHFRATRIAARDAYIEAGVNDPADQLDFAEIHDAYANLELVSYEDLGFCQIGDGAEWLESGGPMMEGFDYGLLEMPNAGELPVNPSGGLLASGHPVGICGIVQGVYALWQLQGQLAERFAAVAGNPEPGFTPLQLEDPSAGLIHSMAGSGSSATVTILRRTADIGEELMPAGEAFPGGEGLN